MQKKKVRKNREQWDEQLLGAGMILFAVIVSMVSLLGKAPVFGENKEETKNQAVKIEVPKERIEVITKETDKKTAKSMLYEGAVGKLEKDNEEEPLVMLDPGHGGVDGGCVKDGIKEKNINFRIALLAKGKLEEKGFRVLLTREKDAYISKVLICTLPSPHSCRMLSPLYCLFRILTEPSAKPHHPFLLFPISAGKKKCRILPALFQFPLFNKNDAVRVFFHIFHGFFQKAFGAYIFPQAGQFRLQSPDTPTLQLCLSQDVPPLSFFQNFFLMSLFFHILFPPISDQFHLPHPLWSPSLPYPVSAHSL